LKPSQRGAIPKGEREVNGRRLLPVIRKLISSSSPASVVKADIKLLETQTGPGGTMPADRKAARILKKLYNLEVMAVQIYRTQIDSLSDPEERNMMVAAMENEELHRDTFLALLKARGLSPSPMSKMFWIVGQTLGRVTSLFGRKAILKGDITFEDKATEEYTEFLRGVNFTQEEKRFLSQFLEDEKRHSANWQRLLERQLTA
jgi:demethoxyubiquinone hydroxylase (CLK1/Coq7/Cat5 family)